MSKLAIPLSVLFMFLNFSGCDRGDPKVEAEKTAAIAKVIKFFSSIPQEKPEDGGVKCYREGTTSKIFVVFRIPTRNDNKRLSREALIELLGTYFIVQEIRDLSKHHVTLTWIEQNMGGQEQERLTVAFSEILPHYNAHDF
jgi:hypothetical protein